MTRSEIQKSFKRICPPRYDEKQSVWFSRLARQLGWKTERVQSLWKDDRCKPSLEEGVQLSTPTRFNPEAKNHLDQLRIKLEEQSLNISRLERDLAKQNEFKRKLGEFLAAH